MRSEAPLKHVPARAQASQRGRSGGITSAGSTPGIVRRVPDMWRRIRFESSHSHFMQVGGRAISFDRCYLATRRLCRRAGAQRLRRRLKIHLSRAPCTCQSAAAVATGPSWAPGRRPLRASDRTRGRVSHPRRRCDILEPNVVISNEQSTCEELHVGAPVMMPACS